MCIVSEVDTMRGDTSRLQLIYRVQSDMDMDMDPAGGWGQICGIRRVVVLQGCFFFFSGPAQCEYFRSLGVTRWLSLAGRTRSLLPSVADLVASCHGNCALL